MAGIWRPPPPILRPRQWHPLHYITGHARLQSIFKKRHFLKNSKMTNIHILVLEQVSYFSFILAANALKACCTCTWAFQLKHAKSYYGMTSWNIMWPWHGSTIRIGWHFVFDHKWRLGSWLFFKSNAGNRHVGVKVLKCSISIDLALEKYTTKYRESTPKQEALSVASSLTQGAVERIIWLCHLLFVTGIF